MRIIRSCDLALLTILPVLPAGHDLSLTVLSGACASAAPGRPAPGLPPPPGYAATWDGVAWGWQYTVADLPSEAVGTAETTSEDNNGLKKWSTSSNRDRPGGNRPGSNSHDIALDDLGQYSAIFTT